MVWVRFGCLVATAISGGARWGRATACLVAMCGVASYASAQGVNLEAPAKEALILCAKRHITGGESNEIASRACPREYDVWQRLCLDRTDTCKGTSLACADPQKGWECDREFSELTTLIQQEWRPAHPPQPKPASSPVEIAIQDYYAGRPLRGLPNLHKPVYLVK